MKMLEAHDKLFKSVKHLKSVIGSGIGTGCIIIYLENKSEIDKIPKTFEGHKVNTTVTKPFVAE